MTTVTRWEHTWMTPWLVNYSIDMFKVRFTIFYLDSSRSPEKQITLQIILTAVLALEQASSQPEKASFMAYIGTIIDNSLLISCGGSIISKWLFASEHYAWKNENCHWFAPLQKQLSHPWCHTLWNMMYKMKYWKCLSAYAKL